MSQPATVKPRTLTIEEAGLLARQTDYAFDAAHQRENPINWGDAAAFYLEGWRGGMKHAIQIIAGYKPKRK